MRFPHHQVGRALSQTLVVILTYHGCADSPKLLEELSKETGELPTRLTAAAAAEAELEKITLDESKFRFLLNEVCAHVLSRSAH
jgi:hypothetical protein